MKEAAPTREAEVLLACLGEAVAPGTCRERIGALAHAGLDWNRLVRLAIGHGLMPALYRYVATRPDVSVPTDPLAALRAAYVANGLNNTHRTRELVRLLAVLDGAGARALAFKGPVLAALAYGDHAMRQWVDLDLLVRRRDLVSASRALTAEGYRARMHRPEALFGQFFQAWEDVFRKPGELHVLDVHWELSPGYFAFVPDTETLFARAVEARLGDATVQTLSPADTLMFLCVHGTKHGWPALAYVLDVAMMLRAAERVDLDEVLVEATRLGSRRMLLLGLALAHALAASSLPDEIARETEREPMVSALTTRVTRELLSKTGFTSGAGDPWRVPLGTIESPAAKLRFVAGRLFVPSAEDWAFLELPHALFPLYYGIRPFRLALRKLPALIRGVAQARLPSAQAR